MGVNSNSSENKESCKFYFSAKTQHQNLGDLIINRELLALAHSYGSVSVLSGGMPESFLNRLGVRNYILYRSSSGFIFSLLVSAIRRIISYKEPRVYFLLNPGGFSGGVQLKALPKQFAIIIQYALLKIVGVRIVRLGASFGPFYGFRTTLEKVKHRMIYKNTGRDSISLNYAKEIGLSGFEFFPDFAYFLSPPEKLDNHEADQEPYVIMSFRSELSDSSYDAKLETKIKEIMQARSKSVSERIIFATQVSFDEARNLELCSIFTGLGFTAECSPAETDSELFELYRGAEAVFSNRLHVLLFALRQGTPAYAVIDLNKNSKVAGLYADMDLACLVCDISDVSKEENVCDHSPEYLNDIFFQRRNVAVQLFNALVAEEA